MALTVMFVVIKLFLTVFSLAIAVIPFWLYMLIRYLLGPIGFWENFITFLFCILIFGLFQFILGFLWIHFLCFIWSAPELQNRKK